VFDKKTEVPSVDETDKLRAEVSALEAQAERETLKKRRDELLARAAKKAPRPPLPDHPLVYHVVAKRYGGHLVNVQREPGGPTVPVTINRILEPGETFSSCANPLCTTCKAPMDSVALVPADSATAEAYLAWFPNGQHRGPATALRSAARAKAVSS